MQDNANADGSTLDSQNPTLKTESVEASDMDASEQARLLLLLLDDLL